MVRSLARATALVVVLHVVLVWSVVYEGSFSQATRNGYAGFLIFHVALGFIAATPFLRRVPARRATIAAFLIVCVGATGAVFRYEVVSIYRVPVVAIVVIGVILVVRKPQLV